MIGIRDHIIIYFKNNEFAMSNLCHSPFWKAYTINEVTQITILCFVDHYAIFKEFNAFEGYILHLHVISYVPNTTIKYILIQPDKYGIRGKWITKI